MVIDNVLSLVGIEVRDTITGIRFTGFFPNFFLEIHNILAL
ncbi:hypothetical protein JCM19314_137 [Nonlabens ulvanivorans]|uniref:Uncharacterized protein n=1 Tax=Nonlabens ulvanivorans TaxID=906888 RepID=A0A090Q070_NONUL|nr:hypothetical protein JCM19297_1352 [Nonlabens ulvanivorans]GAK95123.1 hypothetical protein JCM19298_900 [Nonlabens ulvanivorans]GAL00911.1 hypothetical protein JCM19314_137 [Nonlabens ulvanivorans]